MIRTNEGDSVYWVRSFPLVRCRPCIPSDFLAFYVLFAIESKQKGKTDEEGTDPQGGCGLLGYKSNAHGVPITTRDSNRQISVVCGGKVFRLAKKPH